MHGSVRESRQRQLLESLSLFAVRLKYIERMTFFGMSGRQLHILATIHDFAHPPSISEVARACSVSHQNIKQILRKLDEAGCIALHSDAQDSRIVRAVCTPAGNELVAQYRAKMDEIVAALLDGIDEDEIETTIKVIEHVNLEMHKRF